jgi:hypothetical protein
MEVVRYKRSVPELGSSNAEESIGLKEQKLNPSKF